MYTLAGGLSGRRRGIAVMTALLTVTIIVAWVIATTSMVNQQARFLTHADLKSQANCLARTGLSRSMASLNENSDWFGAHQGQAQADTSLAPDSACWLDSANQPDTYLLRVQSKVNSQRESLTAVLFRRPETDTKFYSLSTTASGQDYIAWSTANSQDWSTLPPLKGITNLSAVVPMASGDVYALAGPNGSQGLWRYREGRGWLKMPSPPGGVGLKGLVAGGDNRVVSVGSNGKLMSLEFNPSLTWKSIDPPAGMTVNLATVAQSGDPYGYVTAKDSGGTNQLLKVDLSTGQMQAVSGPEGRVYDPNSGALQSSGASNPFDGGLSLGPRGELYVANNVPGAASTISRYSPGVNGQDGAWETFGPIPKISWQSGDSSALEVNRGFVDQINNLQADDQGRVWMQWSRQGAPDEVLVLTADSQAGASSPSAGARQSSFLDRGWNRVLFAAALLSPQRSRAVAFWLGGAPLDPGTTTAGGIKPPGNSSGTMMKALAIRQPVTASGATQTPQYDIAPVVVPGEIPTTASDISMQVTAPVIYDPIPAVEQSISPPQPSVEPQGASDQYGIFSARPDFVFDPARDAFTQQSGRSQAEQKYMSVGPGKNTGRVRYVPVAEI